MSSMGNTGPDQTTQQQQQQGNETFLSPEERKQLQRLMGHPTDYPKEMMSHIKGWLEVNPPDFQASTFKGKGVPRYIDRKAAAAMTAASGAGTKTMYSYNLKAKTLSPTGQLKILCFLTFQTPDVSNDSTLYLKFGSTTFFTVPTGGAGDPWDANARPAVLQITVVNAGAYNSQFGHLSMIYNSLSGSYNELYNIASAGVDFSQDQEIALQHAWAGGSSNDIVTPQYLAVEVFNPVGA